MPSSEVVSWRTEGKIAIIQLNHPAKLNALGFEDFFQLSNALREIVRAPEITTTLLIGAGRFFSSGADFANTRPPRVDGPDRDATRQHLLRTYALLALDFTRSFYTHPKILIAALNGPAVGLAAACLGFCDFIYATPSTYLLTPFSSLGLIIEGGSSIGLVQRMGMTKANEALIMSKKITCEELLQCGFLNKVFQTQDKDDGAAFLQQVLEEVRDRLGDHLDHQSMLQIKTLIRKPYRDTYALQGLLESMHQVDQMMSGAATQQFEKLWKGGKRHKL